MPLPGPLGDSPLNLAAISGLFQIIATGPTVPVTTTQLPEPTPRPGDSVKGYFPTIVNDPFLGVTTLAADQVLQGNIGNCPVPAVLAALAHTRPNVIKGMIAKLTGAVLYTPVFPAPPTFSFFFKVNFLSTPPIVVSPLVYQLPVPVQSTDPAAIMYAHSPGERPSWVSLLEKAYVLKKDTNANPLLKSYSVLDGGGKGLNPIEVMNDIAGTGAQWVVDPAEVDPSEVDKNHPWTQAHLRQVFTGANQVPTIAASRSDQKVIDPLPVFAHHDYAVKGMLGNGKVQLYNCHDIHGSDPHHFKDPSLTMAEFQKGFLMVVLKP
jgi:hypothetical protein